MPDKVENDFESAKRLNVDSTDVIAKAMKKVGGIVLYISTDYVFDGKNAPYSHEDPTCPINKYGVLKRDGEVKVMDVDESTKRISLRLI